MYHAPEPALAVAFQMLVDSMLDRVHRHVRLMYPCANTYPTVAATFARALGCRRPASAPGTRAWLYGLARNTVHDAADDAGEFERLNAAGVVYGVREVAESLTGTARFRALASVDALASLSCADQVVLRLRAIEAGMRLDELAWVLGVELAEAETALVAAHERLCAATQRFELSTSARSDQDVCRDSVAIQCRC